MDSLLRLALLYMLVHTHIHATLLHLPIVSEPSPTTTDVEHPCSSHHLHVCGGINNFQNTHENSLRALSMLRVCLASSVALRDEDDAWSIPVPKVICPSRSRNLVILFSVVMRKKKPVLKDAEVTALFVSRASAKDERDDLTIWSTGESIYRWAKCHGLIRPVVKIERCMRTGH